jgi:hypothetical protein
MNDMPPDPFRTARPGAVAMHEMYEELKAAGFTDDQAFTMVLEAFKAALAQGMKDEK